MGDSQSKTGALDDIRYVDKSPYFNGKKFIDIDFEYHVAPDDVIEKCLKLMKVNQAYLMAMKYTESASEFYRAAKDVRSLIPDEYAEDVFYAIKNGFTLAGVPSKLVTLLSKAKQLYDYPNVALSMISWSELKPFFKEGILGDNTLCDIASNIWKTNVKIISPYRKRVDYSATTEVYVEKCADGSLFDTICILPKDISTMIPDKDITSIIYDPTKGLVLNGEVLRQYNGRIGITLSDVDLSGAF